MRNIASCSGMKFPDLVHPNKAVYGVMFQNAHMPRSNIHGSPRLFYFGFNLTDDPGNANFRSPIRMHYNCMIKYYYV